jgi:hypothetical protein
VNKFTYFQLQRKFFDVGESCAAEYFEKTSDCEETESRTTNEALYLKYKNLNFENNQLDLIQKCYHTHLDMTQKCYHTHLDMT